MTLTIPRRLPKFSSPAPPIHRPSWLAGLEAWRKERRTQLRLDDSDYTNAISPGPSAPSPKSSFSSGTAPSTIQIRRYTPKKFLAETERRLGPI